MLIDRHRAAWLLGTASFALCAMANAATVMDFSDHPTLAGPIELQAYAFDPSVPPVAAECLGLRGHGSFTVTRPVDDMSPQLAEASQSGKRTALKIDDTQADGTHVAYHFTNAVIGKIERADDGDQPMESISISYAKIQWEADGCKMTTPARRDFYRCKGLQAFACPWRDTRRSDFPSF